MVCIGFRGLQAVRMALKVLAGNWPFADDWQRRFLCTPLRHIELHHLTFLFKNAGYPMYTSLNAHHGGKCNSWYLLNFHDDGSITSSVRISVLKITSWLTSPSQLTLCQLCYSNGIFFCMKGKFEPQDGNKCPFCIKFVKSCIVSPN
jgi:hypothetical protein